MLTFGRICAMGQKEYNKLVKGRAESHGCKSCLKRRLLIMFKRLIIYLLTYLFTYVLVIQPVLPTLATASPDGETREVSGAVPKGSETRAVPDKATKEKVIDTYGKLPLYFIENRGQVDERVDYYVKNGNSTLYLTKERLVFDFVRSEVGEVRKATFGPEIQEEKPERLVFSLNFLGARKDVRPKGREKQEAAVNYLTGNDPNTWKTDIPTYGEVAYENVYEGIDLRVYGHAGKLKYDFMVRPGTDPKKILLAYNGIEGLSVSDGGDLIINTAFGELKDSKPLIYQDIDGKRVEVDGNFKIKSSWELMYGFDIGSYNPEYPLIIDPTLIYSTYLGGSWDDYGQGIAVDAAGNAYVTGHTTSSNFPTASPIYGTYAGSWDVFVTKINAEGNALVYSTYLGGRWDDDGYGIAVDAAGNAYVTGHTYSTDFPTASPIYGTSTGYYDAFVTKINAEGNALTYSTYLGGSWDDDGRGIAVDTAGNAYITGRTYSTDFPTASPIYGTFAGFIDVFVTKINAEGNALVYSTYLGGIWDDQGYGIAVDTAGNAYITGRTDSTDFPTASPMYGTIAGNSDVFVTKINAEGNALTYSTYLGGGNSDYGRGIAVDAAGNAYVTGHTYSTDFPTASPIYGTYAGGSYDVFVTKIHAEGIAVTYSTYLGGSDDELVFGIAVDGAGSAHITGQA